MGSSLRSPRSTGWLPPSTSFSWSPSSQLVSLQIVCQRSTNATQNCSLSPRPLPQSRRQPSATSQAGRQRQRQPVEGGRVSVLIDFLYIHSHLLRLPILACF